MSRPIFIIVFTIFLLLNSCDKSQQNQSFKEYKSYEYKGQDWKSKRITQTINNINYSATEVPIQYYLTKNAINKNVNIDSLLEVNSRERVLEIEFQHSKQVDLLLGDYTDKSYEDAVKYLAFKISKDFRVITSSNDTISCSGVNFERNFKIAPFKRILIYFNDINPEDNIKLVYHDNLFRNGVMKFNFNDKPLKL